MFSPEERGALLLLGNFLGCSLRSSFGYFGFLDRFGGSLGCDSSFLAGGWFVLGCSGGSWLALLGFAESLFPAGCILLSRAYSCNCHCSLVTGKKLNYG